MKKLVSLIVISTLLLSSLGISSFSASESAKFQTNDLSYNGPDFESVTEPNLKEEKIICDATVEDDFEDDSVIVVFKNT